MIPANSTFTRGVLPVLAASILWAFGYFARKIALAEITPLSLTAFTAFIVSIFLLIVFPSNPARLWHIFKSHAALFFGLAIFGVILGGTFMYIALDHLDLGLANMLEKLQPLFVVILAYYFLQERYSRATLAYCALALFASWVIAADDPLSLSLQKTDLTGLLAVIGAALSWAIATIFGKKLMQAGLRARDVTTIRFLLASILLLPCIIWQGDIAAHMNLSIATWLIVIAAAIISTGFGYVLYYAGLRHIPASTSNFLELATPVVSIALGLFFLGESLTFWQIFFIPIMLFSVYKISAAKKLKDLEKL